MIFLIKFAESKEIEKATAGTVAPRNGFETSASQMKRTAKI